MLDKIKKMNDFVNDANFDETIKCKQHNKYVYYLY